jgi:hypothetical protein
VAHLSKDKTGVNARIVLWGIPGAGVSTNLRVIHEKLRADHRGELRAVPTSLDPSTFYELLPIELGQVNGLRTELQVIAVPAGPEHAPTRKQLLDHIDGLVLIVDSQPERVDENLRSLAELRSALSAYGRTLEELPVVVQYNKRDLSDPYTIEELHRKLGLPDAAVFEGVAHEATSVLQTLTTISKRVIRALRETEPKPAPEPESRSRAPTHLEPTASSEPLAVEPRLEPVSNGTELMEEAILAEADGFDAADDDVTRVAQQALDRPWEDVSRELKGDEGARIGADFDLVSVGIAERTGRRAICVPIVLGNPEGETVTLSLTIQLDPLLDRGEE